MSNRPRTYYYLLLDASGSMAHLTDSVKKLFKDKIQSLDKEARKNKQDVRASVYVFNSKHTVLAKNVELQTLLNDNIIDNYYSSGSTALFNTQKTAIEDCAKTKLKSDDAILFETITDGEDTDHNSLAGELNKLMKEKEKTGQWSFIFQLPVGCKQRFINTFGISSDNIREWEQTTKGLEETVQVTSQGYGGYMKGRSVGLTSTTKFYADLDVSDVSSQDLKNELTDMTRYFKVFEVDREQEIRDFVEKKTRKEYTQGSTYYQISKKETLKADRDIYIMEKGKARIYGGMGVRQLLGLPENKDVKVNPLNLSKYNIFLESRSTNRKLVRGTDVIVNVDMLK